MDTAVCRVTREQIRIGQQVFPPNLVRTVQLENETLGIILIAGGLGSVSLLLTAVLTAGNKCVGCDPIGPKIVGAFGVICLVISWVLSQKPSYVLKVFLHGGGVASLRSQDRDFLSQCESAILNVVLK